ncbi:LOW QUALITY PROTEIN: hypothetical protein QC763_0092510 [Podospora pseudopauciseta]|uniref:Uncharacterized protein n=1 Tax=Podospora pseudopauciseta TaxID=2093780 RepID=A0ABR0H4L4_9PEZI|nr:LOW QUALITY PROTEIN: hypothetical protein QC763_0092510 [Podospora pseudopauciseta]
MKAVIGWEGRLNNFFLKSLDLSKHTRPNAEGQDIGVADQQLLKSLEKAKADVDNALCDSFNTSAVMRILSDLVTKVNSAEKLADETVLSLARWVTRIVTIFGLDPEGDLTNSEPIGSAVDHDAISKLADEATLATPTSIDTSAPYSQVLQEFRKIVKDLASGKAPARIYLFCLRDVHLWNLVIYLEDRNSPLPALVRLLDRSLIEARAEQESLAIAKAKAKLEQKAKEAEKERELRERAKIDPAAMFKTSEYKE